LNVITSIVSDNIQPINDVPLGPTFKWKIAFLHQNPDEPRLVSIYSLKKLKRYFQGRFSNQKLSYYDYHRLILDERDLKTDKDILVFSKKIWEKMDQMEAVDKQQRSFKESMPSVNVTDRIQTSKQPLNQILYGPPGTGKTYHTVNKALKIIDPGFYKENREDRESLNNRFRALIKNETVKFITFHQSFSYEDFVEGL
jgi:5-methylcytosine-specific restriction protein B